MKYIMSDNEIYYMQDCRSFVGNSCVFWAKGNNGYTTKVEKAETYTKDEAFSICKRRATDKPILKKVIDRAKSNQVDVQDLRRIQE